MNIRFYQRLLVVALLAVPVMLLLIVCVDEPLANLLHAHGAPLRLFFAGLMQAHDIVIDTLHAQAVWLWPGLLVLFIGTRLRRRPGSTIWLVGVLGWISGSVAGSMLKVYFDRPRPSDVFHQLASNANFWQVSGQFDAFPSGHAAGTAGLLLPWALRFPKARPWLLSWLGLVCLGRVVLELHWLSDVVAGAALGLLLTCGFELATWWLRPKLREYE
ncbi:phosphatase PAP2 family protein [Hymenobacter actinosclerus]|uniref:PAP2 superfamily protein n=1 Tax=Hymenobacter actinosclerus TaxID=82805 RepID=A0A1I0GLZ2_9BACT|nr:phosphatase PAP2 family protein [Hymenobacter actinosclerus]SET71978.1 PAP2 superfamily protein [Hymenobacter actinosclerus]